MKKLLSWVGVCLGVLTLVGCSEPIGEVSGKVTFLGKPVTMGTVVMVGPNGKPTASTINADGTYKCVGVGAGKCRITVSSPQPAAAPTRKDLAGKDGSDPDKPSAPQEDPKVAAAVQAAAAEQMKTWVAIPGKYADPNQTDLYVEVKGGPNTHNLELK